jgi:hypothetical protein
LSSLKVQRSWRDVAFLASAGAAAIHLGAVHAHIAEYAPAGMFMLLSGLAQMIWALWIVCSDDPPYFAGLAGNLSIVMLWLVSRTSGLPFGMNPGIPEHIHSTDALATALEVVIVIACWMQWTDSPSCPSAAFMRLTVGATFLAAFATGHEPVKERVVAIAALALVCVARALIIQPIWRFHASLPSAGLLRNRFAPRARPAGSAG